MKEIFSIRKKWFDGKERITILVGKGCGLQKCWKLSEGNMLKLKYI